MPSDPCDIVLDGVSVWRTSDTGDDRRVVEGFSLDVRPGERVAIVGPNGAGKTSVLLSIVGAVGFEGSIRIAGEPLGEATLAAARQRVAFVFADPGDQLFCDRVDDEVAFALRNRGLAGDLISRSVERALDSAGLVGLESRSPRELSLGEQKRLALATGLAVDAGALLLDEPTAMLDPRARRGIIDVLAGIETTQIHATHDLDAALDLDARVVLLDQGRIVDEGPAASILRDEALLSRAGLELPRSIASRDETT